MFYIFLFKSVFALENKILFKVNNEIITSVDIINEIEYLKLINKNLDSLENEKIFDPKEVYGDAPNPTKL